MKHRENTLNLYLLAIAVIIGLVSANGFAQDTKPFDHDMSLEQKIEQLRVSIDIDEPMNITMFLEEIQEQVPTPLNILVSPGARSVFIPEMKLQNVSVRSMLNASVIASESEMEWFLEGEEEEVIIIVRDERYNERRAEEVSVVNVAAILKDTEEASLLSAIEIGLEMQDRSKKNVTIKLHKETRLLFVKGVKADINIVMKVVSELGGKPWPPKGRQDTGGFGGRGGSEGVRRGSGGVF